MVKPVLWRQTAEKPPQKKGHGTTAVLSTESSATSVETCVTDANRSRTEFFGQSASDVVEDADDQGELLLSIRDFMEGEEGASRRLAVVQQLCEHIHARSEELEELRAAATKSVEKLGGDAVPVAAKPQEVASALLAVVKSTTDSIDGVNALLSGTPFEETVVQVTRSLKPKEKPEPIGCCSSTMVLSLKRSTFLFPPSAVCSGKGFHAVECAGLGAGMRSGDNVSEAASKVHAQRTSGSTGQQSLFDVIKVIQGKLKIVQSTRNACSLCLYLLGDKDAANIPIEELPTRLLLRAQDLFVGLTQVQDIDLDDDTESEANQKPSVGDSSSTGHSPLAMRLLKLVKVFKSLRCSYESMKLREIGSEKQKEFLLSDMDDLRATHEAEKHDLQGKLEGLESKLRERDNDFQTVQEQNAALRDEYSKVCAECKLVARELDDTRGTLDDLRSSLEGIEAAAGAVHSSSASMWGQISRTEQGLTEGLSSFLPTSHLQEGHIEDGDLTEGLGHSMTNGEGLRNPSSTDSPSSTVVIQLVEESAGYLRQCEESLKVLERSLVLVPGLGEWIKQQYLSLKDSVLRAEEEVRTVLHCCYRSTSDLLYDNVRTAQRYGEVVLELDVTHDRWRARLRDIETAHQEHIAVLSRRLKSARELSDDSDVLRAETARWQAHAEAASEEAQRLRERLRAAECREVRMINEIIHIAEVEPVIAPEPCRRDAAVMTDLPPAPARDEAADLVKVREELSHALEYAKHQADDAARCRSLMQEQLQFLDGAQAHMMDSPLPLGKLIETHARCFTMCMDGRKKLLESWQTAQHNISYLKQQLNEKERQYNQEAAALEAQVKDLRARVQRKLEMDMITQRQIEDAEQLIDREFQEMYRRTSLGSTVTQRLQELRMALLERIRMQRGVYRLTYISPGCHRGGS